MDFAVHDPERKKKNILGTMAYINTLDMSVRGYNTIRAYGNIISRTYVRYGTVRYGTAELDKMTFSVPFNIMGNGHWKIDIWEIGFVWLLALIDSK